MYLDNDVKVIINIKLCKNKLEKLKFLAYFLFTQITNIWYNKKARKKYYIRKRKKHGFTK